MHLLDIALASPEDNLALDESLFRILEAAAETGADTGALEFLRLWESRTPVVVVGRSGRIEDDVDVAACRAAGVPVLRRASGGGTVVLGPGCLCFALVLSYRRDPSLRDVGRSYDLILGRSMAALRAKELRIRGRSDLALGDRKVSGSAQLRGRHGLLHQGTLLHALDPALLTRFLREPRRRPRYRAQRTHAEFVGHLALPGETLRTRLTEAWSSRPVDALAPAPGTAPY